jgi:urease subunit gamma/beta
VRLTAWEEERLLLFSAAELARRRRDRGIPLSAPEAIAIVCDVMLETARDGASLASVEAAGRAAVRLDQVLDGVRELVDEVRLEVLLDDGTRLVVLVDPLGNGTPPAGRGPGAIVARPAEEAGEAVAAVPDDRERIRLEVTNLSRRVVRVSSHLPFDSVNPRLAFDRPAVRGFHLDLSAGDSERWAPGEAKAVELVRFAGASAPDGDAVEGEPASDDPDAFAEDPGR